MGGSGGFTVRIYVFKQYGDFPIFQICVCVWGGGVFRIE